MIPRLPGRRHTAYDGIEAGLVLVGRQPSRAGSRPSPMTCELMMGSTNASSQKPGSSTSRAPRSAPGRLGPRSIVVLSAWCGLVAGLLEVVTLIMRKSVFDVNRLYGMTRHFVWLIPLTDLGLFLSLGFVLAVVVALRPRPGRGLAVRLLFAATLLPAALVAFPRLYGLAWFVMMLGLAVRTVPALERHSAGFRRFVHLSYPIAAGIVPALAAWLWVSDRARESSRARSPAAAGRRAKYPAGRAGRRRRRPPGPLRLRPSHRPDARRAGAIGHPLRRGAAASSWTLPSHASMFT